MICVYIYMEDGQGWLCGPPPLPTHLHLYQCASAKSQFWAQAVSDWRVVRRSLEELPRVLKQPDFTLLTAFKVRKCKWLLCVCMCMREWERMREGGRGGWEEQISIMILNLVKACATYVLTSRIVKNNPRKLSKLGETCVYGRLLENHARTTFSYSRRASSWPRRTRGH